MNSASITEAVCEPTTDFLVFARTRRAIWKSHSVKVKENKVKEEESERERERSVTVMTESRSALTTWG